MGGVLIGLNIADANARIDPDASPNQSVVLALFKAIEAGAIDGSTNPIGGGKSNNDDGEDL